MTKRIAFVETNPPHMRSGYTRCNGFEPYGLELLAAGAKQNGAQVKVLQQNGSPDEEFIDRVLKNSPDILAFSCMTYNYDSSLAIARLAKKQNPNIKTVFGGPHVSSFPKGLEDALRTGIVDYGIKGEADESFNELVANINSPNLLLGGLIYLGPNGVVLNAPSPRIKSLDSLPFALRSSDILGTTNVGRIMEPAGSKQVATATVAYSRGCPFNCSYCDSKNIWGNSVIWRSAKNTVDEVEELKLKYGTNTVFFSDLTFNANPDRVRQLCDELIERDMGVNWYVLIRAATPDGGTPLINKAMLEHMYKAGCRKVGYGLESVIPEVQREFKKMIPNELIADLVQQGHEIGMLSKGFTILGDPKYESPETVRRTLDVLKQIKFDEIRTSFLTAFPRSDLYVQAQQDGDLLTKDFSRYTTDEPILRCRNMTTQELIDARKVITTGYYISPEYTSMVAQKVAKFPNLEESYDEHRLFLKEKGIL